MENKSIKKFSAPLGIRYVQTKTTVRCLYTWQMAKTRDSQNSRYG